MGGTSVPTPSASGSATTTSPMSGGTGAPTSTNSGTNTATTVAPATAPPGFTSSPTIGGGSTSQTTTSPTLVVVIGTLPPSSSANTGPPVSSVPTASDGTPPPASGGTSAPVPATPTGLTSSPTLSDDIFDTTRMIDLEANERHCNDKLETMFHEAFEEFELSFVYGVEATTEDASFVDEMENLILDFVATSVLRCAGEGEAQAVQLRSRGVDDVGVVRIRYPKHGEVTSICKSLWFLHASIIDHGSCGILMFVLPIHHSQLRTRIISSTSMCNIEYQTTCHFHWCSEHKGPYRRTQVVVGCLQRRDFLRVHSRAVDRFVPRSRSRGFDIVIGG